MSVTVRLATTTDLDELMPRVRALNDHEGIKVSSAVLRAALQKLLDHPELGIVFRILRDDMAVGYALTTFAYDLEFGGMEAWLTELWIDEGERGGGSGRAVLDLVASELRVRDILALHLQVRPENPAMHLYERMGFQASPRTVMTKRLR